MTILSFLIQLTSGAMLLLFSVRFMRIGIERLWSVQIHESLSDDSTTFRNLMKGTGLGFLMQGATVVMLMTASLAGSGSIPILSAAVVALGADMGSALAVQFLHLPISALGPLAILVGASLYLRSNNPRHRNMGRTLLGLGLIFLSLFIIRDSVAPLGDMPWTSAVVDYLNRDAVTAALAGLVLTFLMHSSVAAVLTAVAFSAHAGLGSFAGLAFMLGCNLGSALLPVWLLKYENERSKAVALSVAILRCCIAGFLVLLLVFAQGRVEIPPLLSADQMILSGHLAFNFLLLLSAPACRKVCSVLEQRMNHGLNHASPDLSGDVSEDSTIAFPAIKRQVSGMLDIAAMMLEEGASASPDVEAIAQMEIRMNEGLVSVRQCYARLPVGNEQELDSIRQIVEFAIRVERCADVLAGKFLALQLAHRRGEFKFSEEGLEEIERIIDAVRKAIILAQETAWTGFVPVAQQLVVHKQNVAEMEQTSRANHLARLRRGNLTSLASSNQHLEMIADLKEMNSKFATIGYAVMEQHGRLKKSRIKNASAVPPAS
ncbi:phosphate:Na+ symporter [Cohaesibacter sp. ES.047]|uniref:Na/Pi cotransporter family protein n=1 Tax=Cohaesibacter sp. ES.047 TaxID=1798205 RepID=UPI000BB97D6B|nr:Na/Pi symporter [Cohaesibacter sp. ES.047]SNY91666.1 phosphate:Na+ symporter [Cohaesibacter sp. ES.047]